MVLPIVFTLKNHKKGEFVKIKEFTLVIIFAIFLKNDNLGLNTKILYYLGIQSIVTDQGPLIL